MLTAAQDAARVKYLSRISRPAEECDWLSVYTSKPDQDPEAFARPIKACLAKGNCVLVRGDPPPVKPEQLRWTADAIRSHLHLSTQRKYDATSQSLHPIFSPDFLG